MKYLIAFLLLTVPAFASNPYWDIAPTGVPEMELFNPADPANPLQPPPPGNNPRIGIQFSVGTFGDTVQVNDAWVVEVFDDPEFVTKVAQFFVTQNNFLHASGSLMRTHHTIYANTDAFRDGDVGVRVSGLSPTASNLSHINIWHMEGNTPARWYTGDILDITGRTPEPSTLWLALCPLMWVRRWVY